MHKALFVGIEAGPTHQEDAAEFLRGALEPVEHEQDTRHWYALRFGPADFAIFDTFPGNAGVPCHDLSAIELTELGWRQAREVARGWTEAPTLIVTSPYLRTRQTAEATIQRFPDVPVEVWPIEEFTYLQPSRWNGTRSAERMPHLERYWSEADPAYCDGEGAESFGTLLRRAEAALDRLAALPSPGPVYVFSHGQFIQAVRSVVTETALDDRGKMLRFWRKGEPPAIGNAELVQFAWSDDCWRATTTQLSD